MKLTNRNLLIILLILIILSTFGKMFWTGATTSLQSAFQLSKLRAEAYIYSLVVLSAVRELSPVQAGVSFAIFAPFILFLCSKDNHKFLYKQFFLISVLTITFSNIIGIPSAFYGARIATLKMDLPSNTVDIAITAVALRDLLVSFIKCFCFASVIGISNYLLSKLFLEKKVLPRKMIFVFVSIFVGSIAVIATDVLVTYIAYVIIR